MMCRDAGCLPVNGALIKRRTLIKMKHNSLREELINKPLRIGGFTTASERLMQCALTETKRVAPSIID